GGDDREGSRVEGGDAEDRPGNPRPPRSDEARERDDLAAPDLEGDVGEHALARQPLDVQHDTARLGGHLREERLHVAADHRPDHRRNRQLVAPLAWDMAATPPYPP